MIVVIKLSICHKWITNRKAAAVAQSVRAFAPASGRFGVRIPAATDLHVSH